MNYDIVTRKLLTQIYPYIISPVTIRYSSFSLSDHESHWSGKCSQLISCLRRTKLISLYFNKFESAQITTCMFCMLKFATGGTISLVLDDKVIKPLIAQLKSLKQNN